MKNRKTKILQCKIRPQIFRYKYEAWDYNLEVIYNNFEVKSFKLVQIYYKNEARNYKIEVIYYKIEVKSFKIVTASSRNLSRHHNKAKRDKSKIFQKSLTF